MMTIYPQLIEQHCRKLKTPITISIDVESNEPFLCFALGEYKQYGETKVFLSFSDIADILYLNNVIGENGRINGNTDTDETNEIIYDLLSKYIFQMLFASVGKTLYDYIIPLEKHKKVYFRIQEHQN